MPLFGADDWGGSTTTAKKAQSDQPNLWDISGPVTNTQPASASFDVRYSNGKHFYASSMYLFFILSYAFLRPQNENNFAHVFYL